MIAQGVRATLLRPVLALQQGSIERSARFADPVRLRAERDSLAAFLVGSASVAAENEQLRSLLGLGRRLSPTFVPAEVIRGSGRTLASGQTLGDAFLLTEGAGAGVAPGAAIVTASGLVGRVLSVTPETAVAMDWTNDQFRASAMTLDGETFGILKPYKADGREPLLELTGTPFHSDLEPGTLLVTSGHGLFPRGIPIGKVVRTSEADQWQKSYIIRPLATPSAMQYVLVLGQPEPGRSGADLAGSWGIQVAGPTAADTAAAAAAAAAVAAAESERRAEETRTRSAPRREPGVRVPERPGGPRLLGEPVQRPNRRQR